MTIKTSAKEHIHTNPKLLMNLSNKAVERIKSPAKGYVIAWDRRLKGFGCRVTASGVRSFILNYRFGGKERRATIGRFGAFSADEAREIAGVWLSGIPKGQDPIAERQAQKRRMTFAEIASQYIEQYAKPEKSPAAAKEDERKLDKVLVPMWGERLAEDISRLDVIKVRNRMKGEIGHHTANRYVALLSKLFSLAVEWKVRQDNPASRIKPFHEESRDRWLRPDEIRRMFEALAYEPDPVVRGALTFILLTGARRSEALAAKWADIDFDAALWRIPKTKAGKVQRTPLSGHAMALLQSLPRPEGSPWVFPGRVAGKPLVNLAKPWSRVRSRAGLEDVRIHDLRRSLGSMMVQAGASLYVTQRALRHSDSRVTAQVYAHLGDDPVRAAFEVVGGKVAALMSAET